MTHSPNYAMVAEQFCTNGYALIDRLFDQPTIDHLKKEMNRLVIEEFDLNLHPISIFSTNSQQSDNYFLQSADKIRFFLEANAVGVDGKLTVPKERSLNKIGHALHAFNMVFRKITFDEKLQTLAKTIGLKDPVVVQSMIIFKNPQIGGEVVAHQDATFLHVLPKPDGAVVGFWIPLEDATKENGCLEFVPGSHRTVPLMTRWFRHVDPSKSSSVSMLHTNPSYSYAEYNDKFVHVPARSGSCLLIDGLVVHRSAPNRSTSPRPVFTFHLFDRGNDVSGHERKWDEQNWLQPTEQLPFQRLYQQ